MSFLIYAGPNFQYTCFMHDFNNHVRVVNAPILILFNACTENLVLFSQYDDTLCCLDDKKGIIILLLFLAPMP